MYLLTFRIVSKGDSVHYVNRYLDRVKLRRKDLQDETKQISERWESPSVAITFIKELSE
jgi:hypothetical protein